MALPDDNIAAGAHPKGWHTRKRTVLPDLGTADIAYRLNVEKDTAQAFMRAAEGKGAYKLSGKYWRISTDDFERIVEDLKTKPFDVLLIEDNHGDIALFYAAAEWSKLPVRVSVAVDGAAAIACILARRPSLIVMDLRLTGEMNGLDLLRQLQPLHIPTLVYSGSSSPAEIEQAIELGAVHCIPKVSDLSKYIANVQAMIRAALRVKPAVPDAS